MEVISLNEDNYILYSDEQFIKENEFNDAFKTNKYLKELYEETLNRLNDVYLKYRDKNN
jgi:hypothetical protein